MARHPHTAEHHAHDEHGHIEDAHTSEVQATGDHAHGDHDHGDHDHGHEHTKGWRRLLAELKPHSHALGEGVDRAASASADGIRCVKVSLLALGATAAFQVVISAVSGSVALLADTVHNLSDALTAVPLWIAFSLSRRASTKRYPYGYGRVEDLAGLFVVAMIALSAAIAGWESFRRLQNPVEIDAVAWVVVAAIVGFIGNEAVAEYRIRVGTRIGSAALVADGHHARTDGLTSLAVLFGAIGSWAGYPIVDAIVGLAITLAILLILRDAGRSVFHRMLDGVDEQLIDEIEQVACRVDGVQDVTEVRARWSGHQILVELGILVDRDLHTSEAHDIADAVTHALEDEVGRIGGVNVHVDPCDHDEHEHAAAGHGAHHPHGS